MHNMCYVQKKEVVRLKGWSACEVSDESRCLVIFRRYLGGRVDVAEVGSDTLGVLDIVDGDFVHKGGRVRDLHQHGQWLANATRATQHGNLHVVLLRYQPTHGRESKKKKKVHDSAWVAVGEYNQTAIANNMDTYTHTHKNPTT